MFKLRGAGVAGVLALACAAFVPACSSDDAAQAGSGGIVLYPTTKILDADSLGRLSDVSPDMVTFTFGSTNAAIEGIAVNDVVLGGISAKTPYGAMRKVTAVERTGGGVKLTTRTAALTETIEKGTITVPHADLHPTPKTTLADGVQTKAAAKRGELFTRDVVGGSVGEEFTLGFDNYEITDGVTLGASVGFGLGADLSLIIDKTQVTGKFTFTGSESVTVDVNAKYAKTFDKRRNLATYEFPPILIEIGPVPIVVTFSLAADVRLHGDTKVRLAWSGTEKGNAEVGLSIGTNGVDPILKGTASAVDDPLQIEGKLNARGELSLTLSASLNALVADATLSAGGGGFVALNADTSKDPCWGLTTGLFGTYSVKTQLLQGLIPLVNESGSDDFGETTIATGPCGLEGFGFKTWSNVVTPTGYDHDPSLALYPDNTFLVGSSGAETSGYIARYNPDGTPIWERKLTGTVAIRDVMVGADGNGWLGARLGTTEGFARLGDDGTPTAAWQLVSQSGFSTARYAAAPGGGIVMGGRFDSDATGWAAKFDANGGVVWANTYSGVQPNAIAATSDGGVVLFGTSAISGGAKTVVIKLGPDGKVVFAKSYGEGRLFGGTVVSDGGIAASGSTATGEGLVLRANAAGAMQWGFSFENATNASLDYAGNSMFEEPDGFLVGGKRDFSSSADGWLLRVGSGGDLSYSRTYGGGNEDAFDRILKTPDGGALIAGYTSSFGGTSALFLTHVLQSGAISYSNANAFQHNDEAKKGTLPGNESTLTPVVTALPLSTTTDTLDHWTGAPLVAPRILLAE